VSAEFRVDGIPCRRNSVSTGVRVDGSPCRRKSVSTEFRVDGISCRRNFVSTEFRVNGIPFRRGNSMSTEFHGNPGVHNVEKNLKKCFYYKICFFFFLKMR
jgi:hypothetical protein